VPSLRIVRIPGCKFQHAPAASLQYRGEPMAGTIKPGEQFLAEANESASRRVGADQRIVAIGPILELFQIGWR
jgi:hypothetical protein